jgi:uncharacterized membrane protein
LLALSLGCLVERRWTGAALWATPLVFVKEDLGVTVMVLGLVLAWRAHREVDGDLRAVATGAILSAWGAAASLVAMVIVLPALNQAGSFAYASKIDLAGSLVDPLGTLASLFVPWTKTMTWLCTMLVGVGLAVRSPLVLVAVPTLSWRMLSNDPAFWGTGWHYNAVVMPIVFAALLDGIVTLRRSQRRRFQLLARAAPALALAVALAMLPSQPLGDLAKAATYRSDLRAATKAAIVASIPEGSSVGTDLTLMHHLVPTTDVHWLGNRGDPAPKYVIVDQRGATWGGRPPRDVAAYAGQLYGAGYATVRDEESIVVVRRLD